MTIRYAFGKIVFISMRSQTCAWQIKFHSDHLSLPNRSDEGRTLETSAFKFFTVASDGDSRIVKIIMARRTGICFRCPRHHRLKYFCSTDTS